VGKRHIKSGLHRKSALVRLRPPSWFEYALQWKQRSVSKAETYTNIYPHIQEWVIPQYFHWSLLEARRGAKYLRKSATLKVYIKGTVSMENW